MVSTVSLTNETPKTANPDRFRFPSSSASSVAALFIVPAQVDSSRVHITAQMISEMIKTIAERCFQR
ncbi:hypothetical protein [Vibrio sp. 10N.286.49.B3]|uniref:hypothetical protein n=1 Tax=Vibrio sp. 10N.286.49.B3 TaxID=1880855 RepID=UPI001055BB4D|nr:hypothetical protein [Vibrio sp. 10N.286.49.B3]